MLLCHCAHNKQNTVGRPIFMSDAKYAQDERKNIKLTNFAQI